MSTLRLFHLDAFADRPFGGNPAAVCPLEAWLDDGVMQAIAAENNLSETAFFVPRAGADAFDLRWFTPTTEVDLCGHATLASAHVVFTAVAPALDTVRFHTRSGWLAVSRDDNGLAMDLPASPPGPVAGFGDVAAALGQGPEATLLSSFGLAVYPDEAAVRGLVPDFKAIAALDCPMLIATAPAAAGSGRDYVYRVFAPKAGIDEDPVTGSAQCALVPYWADRLGKQTVHGRQVSTRGGDVVGTLAGDRVTVAGRVALYLEGTIRL